MNGIILINKEQNWTSRDVVNKVGKILKTKKIGHTGTLDPMATGLLVLCVGKATKLVEILTNHDKEYIAEVTLGIETDTYDITGKVLNDCDAIFKKEAILKALKNMEKTYDQEVPIYSAVKINGKKLYEYARNNIEVTLPKHQVTIYSIQLLDLNYKDNKTIFTFKCKVSKGTYIRSLINDISKELNTIGVMSKLTRTKVGNFDLKDSYNINDELKITSLNEVFKDYFKVEVDEKLKQDIFNGKLIDNIYKKDEVVFTYNNEVIALYHNVDNKLKPFKMLF